MPIVLVHDYLNIDQQVILDVINKRRYKTLAEFAYSGLTILSAPDVNTDKGEGQLASGKGNLST